MRGTRPQTQYFAWGILHYPLTDILQYLTCVLFSGSSYSWMTVLAASCSDSGYTYPATLLFLFFGITGDVAITHIRVLLCSTVHTSRLAAGFFWDILRELTYLQSMFSSVVDSVDHPRQRNRSVFCLTGNTALGAGSAGRQLVLL